jgi:hypothetical protein
MTTPLEFAQALLDALQLPVTDNNVEALVAAQAIEGGHYHNGAHFNPLNTTMNMPGATKATGIGVMAYTSWDQGLEATVKTLQNGLYNNILTAMSESAPPDYTLHEMAVSPWGWYHIEGGQRIANPIGSAANYQGYANTPDPSGQSISSPGSSPMKKIFLGALLAAGGLFLWSKRK